MEVPPVIPDAASAPSGQQEPARWRRFLAWLVLGSYPLALGVAGGHDPGAAEPALPKDISGLLYVCAMNLALFALVFGVAYLLGGFRRNELCLAWPRTAWPQGRMRAPWQWLPNLGIAWPLVTGLIYSVILRIVVAGVMLVVLGGVVVFGGGAKSLDEMRPKVENVIPPEALADPVYFLLSLTLVSFGVAGLREELWRVGMFAAFAGIVSMRHRGRRTQMAAILIAALIFGLGHLPQGWTGMVMTGILGLGLGWIIVWHESIWEAVIAHGFFDATTFLLLWVLLKTGWLRQLIPI